MVSKIYQMAKEFDIIHIHPYRRAIQFAPLTKTPTVFTIHDPIKGLYKFMLEQTKKQPSTFLITLSNAQRKPLPTLNYTGTVYNGLDLKNYPFNPKPKDFFVFAGRFCQEKGVDLAISAAKAAKVKLKLAGGPDKGRFFKEKIKPYLGRDIQYVGMLNFKEMGKFYKEAKGLLYPIRWEEPFGLVMIEAMACGTPVIAFDRGSAKEVIKDGKTGFVVNSLKEMTEAIKNIDKIKREDCRIWVEKNFTIEKMVENYEKVFYKILREQKVK
jgi:glycosyltransferase involved in cell wall biosynthesis